MIDTFDSNKTIYKQNVCKNIFRPCAWPLILQGGLKWALRIDTKSDDERKVQE